MESLLEEVYRIDGRYAKPIARIVEHLEAAQAYATPSMARALAALARFYRTGRAEDRRAYDIAWVEDRESPLDTINGFIEVYMDARGRKGAWEGLVYYANRDKTEAIQRIAEHAQWFEDRMPWDPKVQKAQGHWRHRACDRRDRRGGRLGARDADRDQPAERSGRARSVRQQIGVSVERLRTRTSGRPRRSSEASLPSTRPSWRAP